MNQNRVRRAAPWITRRLRAGLAWLWENKRQLKGALIQQHGICSSAGECDLGIYPEGHKDMPVIVLEVSYRLKEPVGLEGYLTTEEMAAFIGLVDRAAWNVGRATILETWGGAGQASASFRLSRRYGKGPRILIENYKVGCSNPKHLGFLCSWDGCSWFADGYKKARLPQGWR